SNRFLAAVVPQLAYVCDVDPPVADRDQLYALWRRASERATERGRPLLLVVDGLDEDLRPTGSPSVASLLPTSFEGDAHGLVASRPNPELPGDVPDGHPIKATSRVPLQAFEGSNSLANLAHQEIDGLTSGPGVDLEVDVLGLLAAAAGPMSVRDLASLTKRRAGSPAAHRKQIRSFVTERAGRSLEPVGSGDNVRYQFAHYSLLEYAQKNEDLADPEYREWIRRWADQWR